jgi:flagellar hook protein FlgE
MISGIYPYIVGAGAVGVKNFDTSLRNITNDSADGLKNAVATEKENLVNPLATGDGINLAGSGSVSQSSTGLFAQVSDLSAVQEMPEMIVAQRGYEAYLKTLQAKDETLKYTLDTFA